ncbi:MAG: methyltransferase domain-containing protein, partial [Blastocatellia bacterium]|nr:methyltransferase domain-containing protein [Blastocatellia bacterium]
VFPAIALLTGIINLSLPDLSINGLLVVGSFLLRKLSIDQNRLNYANSVKSLVGFTTLPKEQVEELLLTSTGKLATDWHKKAPKTEEEVEKWYADNSTYYIYDLAQFHLSYKHIVFTLDIIKLAKSRVLDYGAGIGDLSIALAKEGREVTYFDVEGQSKKYAQWQAENFNVKLDFATSHRQLEDKKFDTIIVLDVLEHLYRPEEILDYLTEKLDEGGLMIVSAYFGATKAHPMHFDHKLDVEKYFLERRFHNAKSFWLKLSASESMRRPQMFVYQKRSGLKLAEIGLERAV